MIEVLNTFLADIAMAAEGRHYDLAVRTQAAWFKL
jgi:hypothetical protein